MVRETALDPGDFILPLFVRPGDQVRREISSMPGVSQMSVDVLVEACREALGDGITAVILFGIPGHKDPLGSEAYDDSGIIPRAVRALKSEIPRLIVITDVCMCEYTDHGHCGVIRDGDVDNDPTLDLLAKSSLAFARAGADIIAPSDMMDGRVGAVRDALDAAGFAHVPVMSYAVKYASGFYGPFRDAAESPPQFGDRRGYQMDYRNTDEALREAAEDVDEGADILIVKPALAYGDIIRRVKDEFGVPVAAYNVSGEYAMVEAAAANGWIDREAVIHEILTSLRRAGADILISYWATEAAAKATG